MFHYNFELLRFANKISRSEPVCWKWTSSWPELLRCSLKVEILVSEVHHANLGEIDDFPFGKISSWFSFVIFCLWSGVKVTMKVMIHCYVSVLLCTKYYWYPRLIFFLMDIYFLVLWKENQGQLFDPAFSQNVASS